jgi:hypothetical protein
MNNLLRYILKGRANQQYQERGYHAFRRAFGPDQINTIADLATRLIAPYGGEIIRKDGKLAVNEPLGRFYRPAHRASDLSRHADNGAILILRVSTNQPRFRNFRRSAWPSLIQRLAERAASVAASGCRRLRRCLGMQ